MREPELCPHLQDLPQQNAQLPPLKWQHDRRSTMNASAYMSWCCRLWSRPDFHPGPSGDRSPVCRTTWSLCPSAVVLHTDRGGKWGGGISSYCYADQMRPHFSPEIESHLKHSWVFKKKKKNVSTCCILWDFLWRDLSGTSNPLQDSWTNPSLIVTVPLE